MTRRIFNILKAKESFSEKDTDLSVEFQDFKIETREGTVASDYFRLP